MTPLNALSANKLHNMFLLSTYCDVSCVCQQACTAVEALSCLKSNYTAVLLRTFKRAARQIPVKQKQAQAKVGCSSLST